MFEVFSWSSCRHGGEPLKFDLHNWLCLQGCWPSPLPRREEPRGGPPSMHHCPLCKTSTKLLCCLEYLTVDLNKKSYLLFGPVCTLSMALLRNTNLFPWLPDLYLFSQHFLPETTIQLQVVLGFGFLRLSSGRWDMQLALKPL